jgi:hypothetical protein
MFDIVQHYWPYAATSIVVAVTVVLSASVILYKRNKPYPAACRSGAAPCGGSSRAPIRYRGGDMWCADT